MSCHCLKGLPSPLLSLQNLYGVCPKDLSKYLHNLNGKEEDSDCCTSRTQVISEQLTDGTQAGNNHFQDQCSLPPLLSNGKPSLRKTFYM